MGKKTKDFKKNPVFEAAVLGYIARKNYKKAVQNVELRQKVVKEIIETEKSYIQSLENITVDYLGAFRDAFPPLLPPDVLSIIFGKIEDILLINKQLYDALTSASVEKVGTRIGDIFLKTAPYLKLYSEYCKNYPNSIARYKKKLEDERFTAFVKKVRGDGSMLDLPSLLIMPVQRIPRYKLLLIELLKKTDPADPDYNDLTVALSKVSEVADHINNSIRERENLEKLSAIQKKLSGTVPPILIPRRVFIREGALMKVCRKVSKRRWFMLFNDCLVSHNTLDIAVQKYKFHRLLNLYHGKVKDVADKPNRKNAFQIICKEKSFTVFADTPLEKKSWLASLEAAFKNVGLDPPLAKLSKHYSLATIMQPSKLDLTELDDDDDVESAPVWIPDADADRCMVCTVKFNTLRRRHHCRKCGKVVCAKCSNYSYKLNNLNKTTRVCAFCFKALSQTAPNSVSTLPVEVSDFESLYELLASFNDTEGNGGQESKGAVKVTVKRINAPEKALPLTKGKVIVPQTRKGQRKPLMNITNITEAIGDLPALPNPPLNRTRTYTSFQLPGQRPVSVSITLEKEEEDGSHGNTPPSPAIAPPPHLTTPPIMISVAH